MRVEWGGKWAWRGGGTERIQGEEKDGEEKLGSWGRRLGMRRREGRAGYVLPGQERNTDAKSKGMNMHVFEKII